VVQLVEAFVTSWKVMGLISGFGGLVVSMLASSTPSSRVQTQPKPSGFFGCKNPQHAFLRKGSKAVGPMSQICGTLKNPCDYV
jgi:hypothetical protein